MEDYERLKRKVKVRLAKLVIHNVPLIWHKSKDKKYMFWKNSVFELNIYLSYFTYDFLTFSVN